MFKVIIVPRGIKLILSRFGLLQQDFTSTEIWSLITSPNFTLRTVNRTLINIKTKFIHHQVRKFKAKIPMRGKR